MGDPKREVLIDYTNHRGERSYRRIRPLRIDYENNEWHQNSQWLLLADDLDKGEPRTFALGGIHQWFVAAEIDEATALVKEKPSTSYLQRRMQIGYNRASSIMGILQAQGIVSEPSASGVRTVLR